jgi:hypothetical protein
MYNLQEYKGIEQLDCSTNQNLFTSSGSIFVNDYIRIIKNYYYANLFCITLILDNWHKSFTIYRDKIIYNSKEIDLLTFKELLNETCNA